MFNNSVGLKLGKVSVKDPAAALMFDSCSAAADVKKRKSSVSWWMWWKFPVYTQQVPFVLLVALTPSSSSWTYDHHKLARACMCVHVRIQRTGRGHMTDSISDEGTH